MVAVSLTSTHSAPQAKGLLLLSRQCQWPSDSPLPRLTLVTASIQGLGSKVGRPCPWKRRPQMRWSGWKAFESGCICCTSVVSHARAASRAASHGLGGAGDAAPPGSSHQAQTRLVGVPQLREGRGRGARGRARARGGRRHVRVETPRHFVVAVLQLLPRRRRRNAQDLVATAGHPPDQSSEHGRGTRTNTNAAQPRVGDWLSQPMFF